MMIATSLAAVLSGEQNRTTDTIMQARLWINRNRISVTKWIVFNAEWRGPRLVGELGI